MSLFTETTPDRDGALENNVPVHENTHGVKNRMTCGGTGACLQRKDPGDMGEGWIDAVADWSEKTATVPDFVMGQYIANDAAGTIRTHPYSTNSTANPLTYANVGTLNEVHADYNPRVIQPLHDIYAALVALVARLPHGRQHCPYAALSLQPCNPTLRLMRIESDAWLQADVNRCGDANRCLLWKMYASNGLGVNAANHVNNANIPFRLLEYCGMTDLRIMNRID
ncbi:peptidase M36 [Mycena sanguinolenta]|nr:peptidase M36 [Mycena sanguinolenta]